MWARLKSWLFPCRCFCCSHDNFYSDSHIEYVAFGPAEDGSGQRAGHAAVARGEASCSMRHDVFSMRERGLPCRWCGAQV